MKKVLLVLCAFLLLTAQLSLAAININQADQKTLTSLPGIGASKAMAIIQYRKDHPFKAIGDIQHVRGIGPKIYLKISKEIIVK